MAHVAESRRGSVNIELNIVPFIDLMSCLVAFLLATAVWANLAELENGKVGKNRSDGSPNDDPALSVLVDDARIVVTRWPDLERRTLAPSDWAGLRAALHDLAAGGKMPVEIAADSTKEHPVTYQSLMTAMDTSIAVGLPNVGIVEPASLTAHP